jgi:hypothetical protein
MVDGSQKAFAIQISDSDQPKVFVKEDVRRRQTNEEAKN